MSVGELIKILEKYSPNTVVLLENDNSYENGVYKATNVENYEDGSVYIVTDYDELVEED